MEDQTPPAVSRDAAWEPLADGERTPAFEMGLAFERARAMGEPLGACWEAAYQAAREPHAAPELAEADRIIRDILESLCRRDGLSLESTIVPGEPARNYALAERLGIGHVFGLDDVKPQPAPDRSSELRIEDCETHDGASHVQLNTWGTWLCTLALSPILAEYKPQPEPGPAPELAAAMARVRRALEDSPTASIARREALEIINAFGVKR